MASLTRPSRLLAPVLVGWSLVACSGSDTPESAPSDSPPAAPSSAVSTTTREPPAVVVDTYTGAWHDVTETALGLTADWTNKVELADIDTDGDVDLLFANAGDYESAGTRVANRVFLNDGAARFTDATTKVFGKAVGITRVTKVADVDSNSVPDIVVGTTYRTQSRLYVGTGAGRWRDVTGTNLPGNEACAPVTSP